MKNKSINLVLGAIVLLFQPLTVSAGLPGDLNNDGVVSVAEINGTINSFLEIFPANTISVIPNGSRNYTIQGYNMNGGAGTELTLTYSRAVVGIPIVTQGELAAITSTSFCIDDHNCVIKITAGSPFSGSGRIAAVSFATTPQWFALTSVTPITPNIGLPGNRNNDGVVSVTDLQSAINVFNGNIPLNTVSIVSTGNGTYVIKGSNLTGVGGMELNLSYDSGTSLLQANRGELISGLFLSIINSTVAEESTVAEGIIRIVAGSTSSISSNGPIATVSFAAKPRWFSLDVVKLLDANGAVIQ